MRIGMTYDLRSVYLAMGYSNEETAEFDREDTIEAIARALAGFGHQVEKIGNMFDLVDRLAQNHRWDLVFNIAEGLYGYGRESAIPSLLDAYRIPYTFSDPLTLAVALHKATAKLVVARAGVPTPAHWLVEKESDIEAISCNRPLFVKPVSEGTGKGITDRNLVSCRSECITRVRELLKEHRQAVLVEEYLPGREFTVGIIGTGEHARAIGALELKPNGNAESNAYTYLNKEECEKRVEYITAQGKTAEESRDVGLRAWRSLGCRDAGRVDVRADAEGRIQFIEANPLAGLHPLHSDLPILCTKIGISYETLIGTIVDEASRRIAVAAGSVKREAA